MDLNLKDKRALVTGASRGLGYATALGLAREGARVVINSRDPRKLAAAAQALQAETGRQAIPLAGDVTQPHFAAELVFQAVEALGGLDLLVTNAGGPPAGKFDIFAVEGGTAAMCYIFDSLMLNHLLHRGDTIALGVPTFTPYIEIPHFDRYMFKVVNIDASKELRPRKKHRRGDQLSRRASRPSLRGARHAAGQREQPRRAGHLPAVPRLHLDQHLRGVGDVRRTATARSIRSSTPRCSTPNGK